MAIIVARRARQALQTPPYPPTGQLLDGQSLPTKKALGRGLLEKRLVEFPIWRASRNKQENPKPSTVKRSGRWDISHVRACVPARESPLSGWALASHPGGTHSLRQPRPPAPSLGFPEPGRVQRATALSSTCSVSTAGAAVLLANPCSPPHSHSHSPFFSPSLPPLWGSNNNKEKVLEPGSQCTAFYVRAEDGPRNNAVSKGGRATGLP